MSNLPQEVWLRLAGNRVRGETLWARKAVPDISERLIAALDANDRRHLLILLTPGDSDIVHHESRGIQVISRDLVISGHEPGRYVDIVCLDPAGHEAFDLVGGGLAARLASNQSAAEAVTNELEKWRRFWGDLPSDILSREAQLGLFAELWFLVYWLIPKVGHNEALIRWRGPYGARHDFEWVGRSVEAKCTTSSRGPIHRINGLEQLIPPTNGDLLLFSIQLREEAGAIETLPGLIEKCKTEMAGHDGALSHLESGLRQAGYEAGREDRYAESRLRLVDEGLYAVTGDFPRITPELIIGKLSQGVEKVDYDVNLAVCPQLRVARRPSDSFSL